MTAEGAGARPGGPEHGKSEHGELGETLLSLSARLYRLQTEAIEASGVPLSFQQFRILQRVDSGVTSLSALAGLARRRPSTISKSIDSLVRQGLLARGQAPSDRRAITLSLTAPGAVALSRAQRALADLAAWLAEDVQTDIPELRDLLRRLHERAESRIRVAPTAEGGA